MTAAEKRQELIGQIARFGATGLFLTLLVAAGYWLIERVFGVDPNVSLAIVFVVASAIGYVLHSKISFRGHGSRDHVHVRTVRFFISNVSGFAANQFFVWLLVKQMGGPTWWPIVPMILVTPALTFTLNRKWVFG